MRCLLERVIVVMLSPFFNLKEMFPELDKIFHNAKTLNEDTIWITAMDEEVKQEIIRLNTKDQLFDKGIDSLNRSLGVYSKTSVNKYGKRPGRIQLFDTGEFYKSFRVLIDKSGLVILANALKVGDGGVDDLAVKYGIDIIGITDSNQEELIRTFIRPKYVHAIMKQLMRGI